MKPFDEKSLNQLAEILKEQGEGKIQLESESIVRLFNFLTNNLGTLVNLSGMDSFARAAQKTRPAILEELQNQFVSIFNLLFKNLIKEDTLSKLSPAMSHRMMDCFMGMISYKDKLSLSSVVEDDLVSAIIKMWESQKNILSGINYIQRIVSLTSRLSLKPNNKTRLEQLSQDMNKIRQNIASKRL